MLTLPCGFGGGAEAEPAGRSAPVQRVCLVEANSVQVAAAYAPATALIPSRTLNPPPLPPVSLWSSRLVTDVRPLLVQTPETWFPVASMPWPTAWRTRQLLVPV